MPILSKPTKSMPASFEDRETCNQAYSQTPLEEMDILRDYFQEEMTGALQIDGTYKYDKSRVPDLPILPTKVSSPETPPPADDVDGFLKRSPYVTREDGQVVDIGLGKFGFNWLSPNDYVANWDILDLETQSIFHTLINGNSGPTNCSYYGLKEWDSLPEHLLLLTGAEIRNIRPTDRIDMVSANLKHDGKFTNAKVKCRALSPMCAREAVENYNNTFDTEKMFKDHDASILLISPRKDLCPITEDTTPIRDTYLDFFRANREFFNKQHRKGKVSGFIYSHEIAVASILNRRLYPHTHLVAFYPKGTELPFTELQEDFNEAYPNRFLDMERKGGNKGVHSGHSSIEAFCNYIYKVSTMASTYRREFTYANALEINVSTVQCLHTLIEIGTGTGSEKMPFQRTGCIEISKKGKKVRTKRPKAKGRKKKSVKKNSKKPSIAIRTLPEVVQKPLPAGEQPVAPALGDIIKRVNRPACGGFVKRQTAKASSHKIPGFGSHWNPSRSINNTTVTYSDCGLPNDPTNATT